MVQWLLIFELCPYGIWNMSRLLSSKFGVSLFELCPYGIWNIGESEFEALQADNLNFVPMGFETELLYVLDYS